MSLLKSWERVFKMPFASIYPSYVAKAEKKQRTKQEVDQIICWLTGYTAAGLKKQLDKKTTLREFYVQAPKMHPKRNLITGLICGERVEDIEDPTIQKARQLDKLIDELAKGRPMEKILRG